MSRATGAENNRQSQELTIFHDVAKALTSSLDLDSILQTIMEKMAEYFRPDTWSLLMVDDERDELYFAIAVGSASEALKNLRLKVGEGIAGYVAKHGERLIVPDVMTDPRFAKRIDEMTKWETRSIVCFPVRSRLRVLGVIQLVNVDMQHFGRSGDILSCNRCATTRPSRSKMRARSRRFRNSRSPTTAPGFTMRGIFIRRWRPRFTARRVSDMSSRWCLSTWIISSKSMTPTGI